MAWRFAFTPKARKQLKQLDNKTQSRIKKAVYEKLLVNPRAHLVPLTGDRTGFYKFRVGDYRLLCRKQSAKEVLVVAVKHRRSVYQAP